MPAKFEKIISALDIGTSKVSAIIAGVAEDGTLTVLGSGQRESKGVIRGCVADIQQAELSARQAVEQAERIAGTNIDRVWLGLSAGGLDSELAPAEIDLGGDRIEQVDIDDLLMAGRGNIDPRGKTPLHISPTLYSIDGVGGVASPLGLHADRLEVDIHVVLAEPAPVRNLDMTARAAHLGVEAVVAAPVAAGLACLTAEERELGVALVEMGAGVTNVSVYGRGILVGLKTINQGSADITDSIAAIFDVRRTEAERLKCRDGSALSNPRDHQDILDVSDPAEGGGQERPKVTRAQLNSAICQRVDPIIAEIGKTLDELGFSAPGRHKVVLTGGGAELKGLADHMQGALGRTVRVGRPTALSGLPEAHSSPAFSTLVGLVLYAHSNPVDLKLGLGIDDAASTGAKPGIIARLLQIIRDNF